LAVVEKAIAAAVRVIVRADDPSEIIGEAIRGPIELHAQVGSQARPPAPKLGAWLTRFQLDRTQGFLSKSCP
jgi:hypothetical protein